MSILFFDCSMGAAGDMLTAALLELHNDPEDFLLRLNNCGIPGVNVSYENVRKCGVSGTHMTVLLDGTEEGEHHHHGHHHHHEHMNVHGIQHIISHLNLSDKIKNDIFNVFMLIAKAESKVHGEELEHIHFHEVGTMDAVADITAVCMLVDELGAQKIYASPVNVGGGTVKCAHGVLPVPAPATAEILKGVPSYGGEIKSELCTPTGAALLKYFVGEFGTMPEMCVERIGYGMGKKDFDRPNCIRAFLGTDSADKKDSVVELCCNIDDMTGEDIGFAFNVLLEEGALDVWTVPISMKKNRPAVMLCCMCKPEEADVFARHIFRHTTTLGIRRKEYSRYCLEREVYTKPTKYGEIHIKRSFGWGTEREKAEYADISRIARENDIPIADIKNMS